MYEVGDDGLTVRQREAYQFLRAFFAEHQRMPTGREICSHFGYKSPFAGYRLVKELIKRGKLEQGGNRLMAAKFAAVRVVLEDVTD